MLGPDRDLPAWQEERLSQGRDHPFGGGDCLNVLSTSFEQDGELIAPRRAIVSVVRMQLRRRVPPRPGPRRPPMTEAVIHRA